MALLESVFNHFVLPPKLPGHQDKDLTLIEQHILTRLIRASETLGKFTDEKFRETWTSVRYSLRIALDINIGRLEKASLLQEFSNLQRNVLLIVYIVEQNAALLIRRHVNDGTETVICEVFEASPSSEKVLDAKNALQWDFPGRAVEVPFDEFIKENFRESLATFLEQASMESLKRFESRSAKAKVSVIETRDTTDPALITQMLMPLLEAVGSSIEVARLRKRVRDDVNIQNAELPWRRLPFWLILRVAIQRHLYLALGNESGRACYKFFICTVLAQFLEECSGQLAPELTLMLRAKLCRRLAKLERDKTQSSSNSTIYGYFFDTVGPMLKGIIEKVTEQVELAWENFKTTIARPIPPLPTRADKQALRLSLPSSTKHLSGLLNPPPLHQKGRESLQLSLSSDGNLEQFTKFTDHYFSLTRLERDIQKEQDVSSKPEVDRQTRCVQLAKLINRMFTIIGDVYDSNPEEMSTFILNLFELWVQMDKCATEACPILCEYAPVFRPELLDVLYLPTLSSMRRLQDIQSHLQSRFKNCQYVNKTIFSEPGENCFAVRYLEHSTPLRKLQQRVEQASNNFREKKESEWTNASREYDNLSQKIGHATCICRTNDDGSRNVKGCTKCWHWRCRRRLSITIHEDFLPMDGAQKAAILLELEIPSFLAAYRNATFKIFSDLRRPAKFKTSLPPAMVLKDYSQLQRYMKSTTDGVSLASAKKSFRQTHFKALKMKVALFDVLLPLGLDFAYYDVKSEVWLKDLDEELSFQHLCGIRIPRSLQNIGIGSPAHPTSSIEAPSSYEVVASQTRCPSDISVHEFMSYQRVLSGRSRRWLTMLVELGASNLNFSAEDTTILFGHLAVQAGPAENEGDILRSLHVVFRDSLFCQRLTEQIDSRLCNIATNWREIHCMEMLITLSLRLFNLTSGPYRKSAERLLKTARESTLQWISHLRDEVRNAIEADAAERAARYGLWAALLCRRTFTIFVESDSALNADDLCCFVQASIALQENLVVDLVKLPLNLKNMLVRDVKMAYEIQQLIHDSIKSNPEILGIAINKNWSDSDNSTGRAYSPWKFLSSPNNRWVVSVIKSMVNKYIISQVVHYNFVEGHLLVDGKPLGKLPLNIRESEDVKELFGNQHLLTFPSSLSGMSHVMATRIHGNEVHFGLRGKSVVIRALHRDRLLEFVPRHIFKDGDSFDLPFGLVENCVHWLNLGTNCLEIRRKPFVWRTRQRDWILDVFNREARRNRVSLVDPQSDLFKRVAEIFSYFEYPQRLTVFQPAMGNLSVEIRHLELTFFVNERKLLECRELHAEIDPNQDAGTLYGFLSKIVLRDVVNTEQRSIITPLGGLTAKRQGMHLVVRANSATEYARFGIDNVLGRLSCPPEPRVLYSKAQFHAFTSFVLPDPLTGRTGAEEAIETLKSGYCQPWTPLIDLVASILRDIARLSPSRDYYPKDKRRLQTVTWDQRLTLNVQQDGYEALAQKILIKSDRLRAFTAGKEKAVGFDSETPSHLRQRGEIRRSLYERDISNLDGLIQSDILYKSRDREIFLYQAGNVYQIVKFIRQQPFRIHMTKKLTTILQSWKLIGGFNHNTGLDLENTPACLSDLMDNNVGEHWGSLLNLCRQAHPQDSYKLIFRLGLLSFGSRPDMDVIYSLAAFGCLDELKALEPPSSPCFVEFELDEAPTLESILKFIAVDYPAIKPDVGMSLKGRDGLPEDDRILYEGEWRRLASFLLKQWPSAEPSAEKFESKVIDVKLALKRIIPEWKRLHRNITLSKYIVQVQNILDRYHGGTYMSKPRAWNKEIPAFYAPNNGTIIPSLPDLLVKSVPLPLGGLSTSNRTPLSNGYRIDLYPVSESEKYAHKGTSSIEMIELGKILDLFIGSPDILRRKYGNDLKNSLLALETASPQLRLQDMPPSVSVTKEMIEKARETLSHEFERVRNAFSPYDDRSQWLQLGNLWPCTTPITVLEQLRSSFGHQLGNNMREILVSYGVKITTLQRLLRIRHAQLKRDHHKLLQEWQNTGHENWNPLEFPDWLLLEIESDLLIRREQVDVAHAIISPASGSNSVLQMNMGKGKTSCIVPMVMAILADKKQLSRLIVPKALLLQTAQTVQSRLGGLVGREIRHIPFSRRTSTTPDMLQLYSDLHNEILRCRGIILSTPEHILSYKLSGLQRLADSRLEEAQEMITFQSWLTDKCRDVLDESDFTLAVKTQLIYPSGPQISVDGHPHRWEVAQILLSLAEDHLPNLQRDFPRSIEVVLRPGGFPMVHFLRTDAEDALHHRIIDDICGGRISFLRLADSASSTSKRNIKRVLLGDNLDHRLIRQVSNLFADGLSAHKNILLVRGLLSNKILLLCLKKRWNVQYGLHPNRHPIAVPFDAKGVPSEQAEFGHPDVSILFTCLAFYYSGLNPSQFRQGLQHVLKSDDPAAEYDRWTYGSDTLPGALHHWSVINADDQIQVEELWRHLRLNRNVIDHYMNNFVFPAHAKQFGIKLQASGWDLPLFSKSQLGEESPCAKTTGFSGTNDNKMMLPLTIKQDDLHNLRQTNAEVLTYVLQSRNRKYNLAAWQGKRLSEIDLLRRIAGMEIRILIDAGAYILEMNNETLVTEWLKIDTQAKGAVYFGSDNRAWVQYRGGKKPLPLLATPFAENLDECLVYIDEAHTRGIDLKLPQKARGALTLALGQTKDHTMQAAMRLRQLGTTQSIVFFAPPEVHRSIIDVCKKRGGEIIESSRIDSSHVVCWLLEQTCRANEHLQNLYFAQGIDFCRRTNAQWENGEFLKHHTHRKAYLKVIQHPERQTLEQLYGAVTETRPSSVADMSSPELQGFMEDIRDQKRAAEGNGDHIHSSVLEEVEQEREVEFQVEQVCQVQKPTHYNAFKFPGLHKDISRFVKTGNLSGEQGYEHVFNALARTSIGQKYGVCRTTSQLFVSTEFMRTVELRKRTPNDDFLRPVEWILWNPFNETALIIISEEVEILIPIIRAAKKPMVHLITYAAPVTKNMLHFNKLSYYVLPRLPNNNTAPAWLSIELGIFAGRLYTSFTECNILNKYLRLPDDAGAEAPLSDIEHLKIFAQNPVDFLLEWLTVCRKGQDIMHTPIGYICQGRPLHESHPFFTARNTGAGKIEAPLVGGANPMDSGEAEDGAEDEDLDLENE